MQSLHMMQHVPSPQNLQRRQIKLRCHVSKKAKQAAHNYYSENDNGDGDVNDNDADESDHHHLNNDKLLQITYIMCTIKIK